MAERMEFRKLNADEIDCRISTVKSNGLSLLLYKDARVDQRLLDDTVGAMNWQRSHQTIDGRLYCTVSIRNEATGEWIAKQDVGTESYTEKEKGQASDSFKRACFNWGIGRELYTAPFIWINDKKCDIKPKSTGGKDYTCYDKFLVSKIGYDEFGNINRLVIKKQGSNRVLYDMGGSEAEPDSEDNNAAKNGMELLSSKAEPLVGTNEINDLYNECGRTGTGWKGVCATYGVKAFSELSIAQYKNAMSKFSSIPDKPIPGQVSDPIINLPDNCGLPFN